MARQKKKTIEINKEALSDLLTEIHTEATMQRIRTINIHNRFLKEVEEKIDINSMGKVINDTLKLIENATILKTNVAKILATVVAKEESGEGGATSSAELSASDLKAVEMMLEKMKK